jgi:hypothetical protein
MQRFKLRFPEAHFQRWADTYSYPGEAEIVEVVAPAARQRGHLTRDEFLRLCRWKSPRTRKRCESNSETLVEEATQIALGSHHEEIKIGALQLLRGVSWPTASVILHFCDAGEYPILDFRALWSLSAKPPTPYTFEFWWAYTQFVRDLQQRTGLAMRTIDRALWQYSKTMQS